MTIFNPRISNSYDRIHRTRRGHGQAQGLRTAASRVVWKDFFTFFDHTVQDNTFIEQTKKMK